MSPGRPSRRGLLRGAGAVTVVAAGGVVWRAWDRGVLGAGEGPAYEPWRTWRADADGGALDLVRAAILAASPHNTQPWLFRVMPSRVELFADLGRHVGALDPYRRELALGLGCALENMALAAPAAGLAAEIALVPGRLDAPARDLARTPVASVDLRPAPRAGSDLHAAIPRRHTNRGPYETGRALPDALLRAMEDLGRGDDEVRLELHADPPARAGLGAAVVAATASIIADAEMVRDSDRWFRHDWDALQRHRDGVTLDAAGLPALTTVLAKMLPPPSPETGHRYWLEATRDVQVPTAAVLGLISVRDLYDRALALRAGRLWQRLHLWATTQGLAMQPLNQPVELVDRERQLGQPPRAAERLARLARDGRGAPTFLFRAGYPARSAGPSPRRPLRDVLL